MRSMPLIRLDGLLLEEEKFFHEVRKTRPARRLSRTRKDLAEHLREIGRSGDLRLIASAEKAVVEGDIERYANSRRMSASLKAAHEELDAIERHLDWVVDSAKYHFINETHGLKKTRRGALPLDDARIALASHSGRLANMDKSRLSEDEKGILDARKANVDLLEALYVELQTAVCRAVAVPDLEMVGRENADA